MPDKVGNIFRPLPQRRQAQRYHVQSVIQILAEQPLPHELPQVPVGRGNNPHICPDRRPSADGRIFPLLQYTQKPGLGLDRHIPDFIEEQCPALGLLKPANGTGIRAGKSAFLMTEQLRFNKLLWNGRHVDRHKRSRFTLAVLVKGACYKLLAGAAFSRYQHRKICSHEARQHPVYLLHCRRSADQGRFGLIFLFCA